MPFGKEETKGRKPFFTGLIQEYEGKTRISIWPTEEFDKYMKKLANKE